MTEIIRCGIGSYPKNLETLSDKPDLYLRGELKADDEYAVAVVGSRKVSRKGAINTREYTKVLANAGFTIVSGLAEGVDTIAHTTALGINGTRTIAVLGCGLDRIYPEKNTGLAEKIIKQGALVSEYPPGTRITKLHLLDRNRLVSGLALAVLVIEGGKEILGVKDIRSGTLTTAKHAINQNKEVFAIPGSPTTDFIISEWGVTPVNSPLEMMKHLREIIKLLDQISMMG
jgi:DNA processing protein